MRRCVGVERNLWMDVKLQPATGSSGAVRRWRNCDTGRICTPMDGSSWLLCCNLCHCASLLVTLPVLYAFLSKGYLLGSVLTLLFYNGISWCYSGCRGRAHLRPRDTLTILCIVIRHACVNIHTCVIIAMKLAIFNSNFYLIIHSFSIFV